MNTLKKNAAEATCITCGSKINTEHFFRTLGYVYFCRKECLEKWNAKREGEFA